MALNIPLPQSPDRAFGGALDSIIQQLQNQHQEKRLNEMARSNKRLLEAQVGHYDLEKENNPLIQLLKKAQIQQALAAANKSNLFSSLLNEEEPNTNIYNNNSLQNKPTSQSALGMNDTSNGQQQNIQENENPNIPLIDQKPLPALETQNPLNSGISKKGMPEQGMGNEEIITQGNPRLSKLDKVAGMQGIPPVQTHYDQDGNLITRYPSGKTTRIRVANTAEERERQTSFAKSDAKIADTLQNQYISGQSLMDKYQSLDEALKNPVWKDLQKGITTKFGEKGRRLNLETLKNIGSPEQKAAIADVETLTNDIVSGMAKVFTGPFRVTEQNLIERVKPAATDTLEAAQAKLGQLKKALEMQNYASERVPELIRQYHYTPQQAFKLSKQEIDSNRFNKLLKKNYGEHEHPSEHEQEFFIDDETGEVISKPKGEK